MSALENVAKSQCFLKVGKGLAVILQLYVIHSPFDERVPWFGDSEFECLIQSLHGVIISRVKLRSTNKRSAKITKSEVTILKGDEMTIRYAFRKNPCKDFVLLNQHGTSTSKQTGRLCSSLPVFSERIIATVTSGRFENEASSNQMLINPASAVGVSEYFGLQMQDVLKSAQRKKAALSKMKQKCRGKNVQRTDDPHNYVEVPGSDSSSFSSSSTSNIKNVCRRFEYKSKLNKIEPRRSNLRVLQEDRLFKKHNNEIVTNHDISTPYIVNKCVKSKTEDFTHLAGTCTTKGSELQGEPQTASVETAQHDLHLKVDLQAGSGHSSEVLSDSAKGARSRLLTSRSSKRKHCDTATTSVNTNHDDVGTEEIDRPRTHYSKHSRIDSSCKGTRESLKSVDRQTLAGSTAKRDVNDDVRVTVDDYGDVCLDDISCVTELNSSQICHLVRSMEREIRSIFEGKSFSRRHQNYKLGGKGRAELAFEVDFGKFNEEQQDAITDTLLQLFCYKHTKYFDYILKVLVPETMVLVLQKVNKGIDRTEAEKMLAETD